MTRILIVDDHASARITLRELLGWHSFQVCGDAKNGEEAIEKVIELKPEIVLMDITMPVMNGMNAAAEIRRIAPSTKIVFLTVHDNPEFRAGMRPWAHGFVAKSDAGTELIPTLERVVGITADVIAIECPNCKVRQKIQVAIRPRPVQEKRRPARKKPEFVSCVNCLTKFEAKVSNRIVGGPFIA